MSDRQTRRLRDAARCILALHAEFPELFLNVVPIREEDLLQLEEIAWGDEAADGDEIELPR
jgi:hypothetical protein